MRKESTASTVEFVCRTSLSMPQDRALLQNALKSAPSAGVRWSAAGDLAKIGGEGTVEALPVATHGADIGVRVAQAARDLL